MTSFKSTKGWQSTNDNVISYPIAGPPIQEGSLQREPKVLTVLADSLSLVERAIWHTPDEDTTAGYQNHNYITAAGKLRAACVFPFLLDAEHNEPMTDVEIIIHRVAKDQLLKAGTAPRYSVDRTRTKAPEGGWLMDDVGVLSYFDADWEAQIDSALIATLHVDDEIFESLSQDLKSGAPLRGARIDILVDIFSFDSWIMPSSFRPAEFGLMCKVERDRMSGSAKARLETLVLEWGHVLKEAAPTSGDTTLESKAQTYPLSLTITAGFVIVAAIISFFV